MSQMRPADAPDRDHRGSCCRQEDPQPPRAQHRGARSPTGPPATHLKITSCRAPARISPSDSPTLTQRVAAVACPASGFCAGQPTASHHRPRFSAPRPPCGAAPTILSRTLGPEPGPRGPSCAPSIGRTGPCLILSVVPIRLTQQNAPNLFPREHRAFSNLKTWLRGTHHGVSAKHLPHYFNEFVFRFNRRRTPMAAFQSLLGLTTQHARTTYEMMYRAESTG